KNNDAASQVEFRSVFHRLDHSKRNAHHVAQDKSGQSKKNGHGESRLYNVPDRILINIGPPEIQMQHIPQPFHIADMNRLVETVIPFQFLSGFGRNLHAARATAATSAALSRLSHL